MKYIIIILIAIVSLSFVQIAQSAPHSKTLRGKVVIKNGTTEPVHGATVRIENTVLGAKTDREGKFYIKKLPDGNFTLIITMIGMKPIRKEIEIKHYPGDEIVLDMEMEENPLKTADVVVTATRSEKIYEDVPIKVSTLAQEALEISCSNTIKEGLVFQPGVRTETNCQNCGFSQVRINGLEGKYSQILIDGKAVFSALNGVYGLDQIPSSMLDRVEIIRGGASSLYGGNAIAGVINIITKEPCADSYELSYNGSFADADAPQRIVNLNASVVNGNADMGLVIFGTLNHRAAYDANSDGFSDIGKLDVNTFGGKYFWKIDPKRKLTAEYHNIQFKIRGGDQLDKQPHEAEICEMAESKTDLFQLSYDWIVAGSDKLSVYASMQNTHRDSYYGAAKDPNAYGFTDNDTYAAGATYSSIVDLFGAEQLLTFGYEWNYDQINDVASGYGRNINQISNSNGFFFQDDFHLLESVSMVIGARVDKHNLIDNVIFSPRASMMYKALTNLTFRGTVSTGYRAPQAFDEDLHVTQVGGTSMLIQNSSNLKPEYSLSFTGSADYSLKILGVPLALSVEYFHTTLSDVFTLEDVGIAPSGAHIVERRNGDQATVKGITIEAQARMNDALDFKAGFTAQSGKYSKPVAWSEGKEPSDEILRTPNLYGYFVASAEVVHDIRFDLSGAITGPMFVPHVKGYIAEDVLKKTETFFELGAKLSVVVLHVPEITISLGCKNILNSYQNDFDKGGLRDAGYVYGPGAPITPYFSIKVASF